MIRIEQKKIKNKDFYYLTERVNIGGSFKKIQVYVGKNVPNDLDEYYSALQKKEKTLIKEHQPKVKHIYDDVMRKSLIRLENYALDWKYFIAQKTEKEKDTIFHNFAIRFIFESNSIEGSRLTQNEVLRIIEKKYIKKNTPKTEIQEVYNSINAIDFIRNGDFILNQKNIKILYSALTKDLPGYEKGFKKQNNSVNNKNTVDPKNVKIDLQNLITWYQENKKNGNPFMNALIFHNRFEYIHPFQDGNGRTGRMILVWMLMQNNYDVILFKEKNKRRYFSALDSGDEGRYKKIITYAVESYKETIYEIMEK